MNLDPIRRQLPDARSTSQYRFTVECLHVSAEEPPFFIKELRALGASASQTERLRDFLAVRHPGDPGAIYHGLAHTHETASLTARILRTQPRLSIAEKIMLIFAAALHDVDPCRRPGTPARVQATLQVLDSDPEARLLIADYGGPFRFGAERIKALILATDYDPRPDGARVKRTVFEAATAVAFSGDPRALSWGRMLAFADRISTYLETPAIARRRVEGLANELRQAFGSGGRAAGPTNEEMIAGSMEFLGALRCDPLFASLSFEDRRRFDAVITSFAPRPPRSEVVVKAPLRRLAGTLRD